MILAMCHRHQIHQIHQIHHIHQIHQIHQNHQIHKNCQSDECQQLLTRQALGWGTG